MPKIMKREMSCVLTQLIPSQKTLFSFIFSLLFSGRFSRELSYKLIMRTL